MMTWQPLLKRTYDAFPLVWSLNIVAMLNQCESIRSCQKLRRLDVSPKSYVASPKTFLSTKEIKSWCSHCCCVHVAVVFMLMRKSVCVLECGKRCCKRRHTSAKPSVEVILCCCSGGARDQWQRTEEEHSRSLYTHRTWCTSRPQ